MGEEVEKHSGMLQPRRIFLFFDGLVAVLQETPIASLSFGLGRSPGSQWLWKRVCTREVSRNEDVCLSSGKDRW